VRIAIIVGCVLAAMLAACGGGKSAAQKKAEFQAAADKIGEVVILQPSDLPAGWSTKPPEDDTPEDKAFTDQLRKCYPGSVADKTLEVVKSVSAKEFKGPQDQQLTMGPIVFATIDRAQDSLNLLIAAYSNCGPNFTDFARVSYRNRETGGGGTADALDLSVTYADRNIPKLGDASRGFRLTIDERVSHIVRYVEFQFIRVGHIDVGMLTSVNAAQQDDLDSLPKLVEAKLRAAEATLPK
jgi:hypothetical protein